jgi:hypothetical protein
LDIQVLREWMDPRACKEYKERLDPLGPKAFKDYKA